MLSFFNKKNSVIIFRKSKEHKKKKVGRKKLESFLEKWGQESKVCVCVCGHLFLVLQLVGQPVETLVESVAARRARRLNVPVAVSQRVQTELVGDLRSVHCVG